jgi:hypothetical protein
VDLRRVRLVLPVPLVPALASVAAIALEVYR